MIGHRWRPDVGWGIFLIIIGAGSLVLPSLGFQFALMGLVDGFQPYAGLILSVIGVALVIFSMARGARGTDGLIERPATRPDAVEAPSDDAPRR